MKYKHGVKAIESKLNRDEKKQNKFKNLGY